MIKTINDIFVRKMLLRTYICRNLCEMDGQSIIAIGANNKKAAYVDFPSTILIENGVKEGDYFTLKIKHLESNDMKISDEEAQEIIVEMMKPFLFNETETIEEFDCYVDNMGENISYVSMESRINGDTLNGHIPTQRLKAKGIEEEDAFLMRVIKRGEWMKTEIEAKPQVKLTKEQLEEINHELDLKLPTDDGVPY